MTAAPFGIAGGRCREIVSIPYLPCLWLLLWHFGIGEFLF